MTQIAPVLWLSLGGVLGVNARYWLGLWIQRWSAPWFPWATFAINVTGCFAIGLLATLLARWLPHPHGKLLVLTGFLGGFTTYSSFAFESLQLWERGALGLGLLYMVGTLVAGFVAVALGVELGRALTGLPATLTTSPQPQGREAEAERSPPSAARRPIP